MKRIIPLVLAFTCSVLLNPQKTFPQSNDVLLEFCTGTWCTWCPCGHQIAEQIQTAHPYTLVLAYHGPYSNPQGDPFVNFNGYQIMDLIGFSAYPSGVVGRRTGIIMRDAWTTMVNLQQNLQPGVNITLNKNYNPVTRELTATINSTALQNLTGSYYLSCVIYESNIIYNQSGNSQCPGGPNYVHKWIVRSMVNGASGELLNSGGSWQQGQTITKNLQTTLGSGWIASNCELGVIAYLSSGSLASTSYVQQTKKEQIVPIGAGNEKQTPARFELLQNYPNPFNPVTNIHFSVPQREKVVLKVFGILGNVINVIIDGYLEAGSYNAAFDGSNLSSGVYFYSLSAGKFTETRKMVLMR
jgi:hypothetical protein